MQIQLQIQQLQQIVQATQVFLVKNERTFLFNFNKKSVKRKKILLKHFD